MKRFAFALLLVISNSAWADWTAVGVGDKFNSYADLATIRKQDSTVKMWSLLDFHTAQLGAGYKFSSQKSLDEYDCEGSRSRTLSFTSHSGNMGGGEVVYSNADSQGWVAVSPRTSNGLLLKVACKR